MGGPRKPERDTPRLLPDTPYEILAKISDCRIATFRQGRAPTFLSNWAPLSLNPALGCNVSKK